MIRKLHFEEEKDGLTRSTDLIDGKVGAVSHETSGRQRALRGQLLSLFFRLFARPQVRVDS